VVARRMHSTGFHFEWAAITAGGGATPFVEVCGINAEWGAR